MKKTAVEWMANELLYLDNEYDMKFIDKNEYQIRRKQIIEQAKEMEKEQKILLVERLMEYTKESQIVLGNDEREASEFVDIFYNETFKSE